MKDYEKTTVNFNEEAAVKLSRPVLIFSVATVYLMFIMNVVIRFGANTLYPLIQEEWLLTDGQVGAMASAISLGMAVFVVPVSLLADKWGRTKMVTLLGTIFALGTLLAGFVPNYALLLGTRLMSGIGFSGFAPAASSSLVSWFRRSIMGRVLGLYNTSQQMGVLVGFTLVGVMAVNFGWRGSFYILGGIALFLAVVSLFLPKQQSRTDINAENKVSLRTALPVIFKNKSLITVAVSIGIANAIIVSMLAFLPIFFMRVMEMALPQAATLTGLTVFVGVLSAPLAGFIMDVLVKKDRRSRMWLGTLIFILGGIFYSLGFLQGNVALIMVGAFFVAWFPTIYHTATQELVPDWYRAASYGFVILGLQGIGVLGPIILGFLSDIVGLQMSLTYMSLGYIVSGLGFFLTSFYYRNDYQAARDMEAAAVSGGE